LQYSRSQLSRVGDWSVLGRSDTGAHASIIDNSPIGAASRSEIGQCLRPHADSMSAFVFLVASEDPKRRYCERGRLTA
jgi:hypothetical protein